MKILITLYSMHKTSNNSGGRDSGLFYLSRGNSQSASSGIS